MLKSVARSRLLTSRRIVQVARRAILTQAYVSGPSHPPLIEQTVGTHFQSIVDAYGDRPAVISRHQNVRLTYEALHQRSNALAKGLENVGVKKGDRVAVSLGNNIEYAIATYALFKLGAILVPLNPAFTAQQVVSALNHLTASHLIIGLETNLPFKAPRSNIPLLTEILPNLRSTSSARSVQSEIVPSLCGIVTVDNAAGRIPLSEVGLTRPYNTCLEDGEGSRDVGERSGLHPDEVVNIQFTSGTTSMPKAAQLTHRSILNNGAGIGDRMLLTSEDVVVCPPPLFHCFGCILGYMATATHGSAIVFPTEAFDPTASLKAVQDYSATALYGVPTMFLAELDLLASGKVETRGFEKLRTGIAAGTNVPMELMRKLHRTLNLTDLTICYGMTETSPVSVMTTTDDPLQKRIESVGRCMPHVTAKIVDAQDRSKTLGIRERGELVVSGYLLMKGYWNDQAKTDEVLVADKDGKMWMHTGDEAEMDAEGYVKITGRLKDIIIRGGENVHPLDIENCLLAREDVTDASACGIPDEKYGEIAVVFVIGKEGTMLEEKSIKDYVRERLPGHFGEHAQAWVHCELHSIMIRAFLRHPCPDPLILLLHPCLATRQIHHHSCAFAS